MTSIYSETLQAIFSQQKGIFACDERESSIEKRLTASGLAYSDALRIAYRRMLFSTPSLEDTISGVILSQETFFNHTVAGIPTREYLHRKGIKVGVKVDAGLQPFTEDPSLQVTKGLEGLDATCGEVRAQGATFTKWRSVIPAGPTSEAFITEIARTMATYAFTALQHNMVPIIEPEVLLGGSHTIEDSSKKIYQVVSTILKTLKEQDVPANHCILKTSFATQGLEKGESPAKEAAKKTLEVLKDIKIHNENFFYGVVFLSGGLSSESAIAYMQQSNALVRKEEGHTIPITFSYGRALQNPALKAWRGREDSLLHAQRVLQDTLQQAVEIPSL